MIKMEIKFMDENQICWKGFVPQLIYREIEGLFRQLHLPRVEEETDRFVFCDTGDPNDYARFGRAAITLSHERWFMNNAKEWYFYISDDLDHPEEMVREDFLAFYRAKRMGS